MDLWIADADVSSGVLNKVARVDDSGPQFPTQGSNRHCNDVDVLTLEGETFVVATFAVKSYNELRFYKIVDVRAVLGASNGTAGETLSEIPALHTIIIKKHPSATPISTFQIARSYASDLVVDQGPTTDSEAYIYIAMRTDGIVRVRAKRSDILAQSTPAGTVTWGPVFGNSSHYANTDPGPPFTDNRVVYSNFDWVNQQFDPDVIERSDPPYFTTLALHRDEPDTLTHSHGHKLYVGVDPIGFVVFDIATPAAWGPTTPIDHHEGEPVDLDGVSAALTNQGAWSERIVVPEITPGATKVRDLISYVRAMDVVDTGDGLRLVVTYRGAPTIGDSPAYLAGFAYDDQFQYGGVSHAVQARGSRIGRTRLFRVRDFPDSSLEVQKTANLELLNGGARLFVPSVQSDQLGATAAQGGVERLEFVHNLTSAADPTPPGLGVEQKSICMTSVYVGSAGTFPAVVAIRDHEFVPGRRTHEIGQSLVDPDLIMTADNDGHAREGVAYLVGAPGARSIDVTYDPMAPSGNDRRLTTGTQFNRKGQWLDPLLGSNDQAVPGQGLAGPSNEPATHMVVIQTIPSSFGGTPAISEFTVNLTQIDDRWDGIGRGLYLGGMVDTRYDAWVQANIPTLGTAEYFFLFRQETPDGIIFGRRDNLMALVTGTTVADGDFLTPVELSLANVDLKTLNTHPEFDEFPSDASMTGFDVAKDWFRQAATPHPYRQRTKTFEPELIEVEPRESAKYARGWVLAVPCGVSVIGATEDPDIGDVTTNVSTSNPIIDPYKRLQDLSPPGDPAWLPDPQSEEDLNLGKGLVQFWDFTDPRLPGGIGSPIGSTDLPRIYLPISAEQTTDPRDVARSSFAWHLEGLELVPGGTPSVNDPHSYVIVGDFLGGVHCYEITNVLNGTPPDLQDSWYVPLSKQDLLVNNIRDVVLDREGDVIRAYVAVQRVGVVILRLDVLPNGQITFVEEATLDDAKEPLTLHLRVIESTGERLLYVSDHRQALRVYSSN